MSRRSSSIASPLRCSHLGYTGGGVTKGGTGSAPSRSGDGDAAKATGSLSHSGEMDWSGPTVSLLRFERGLRPHNLILGGGSGRGAKPPSEASRAWRPT